MLISRHMTVTDCSLQIREPPSQGTKPFGRMESIVMQKFSTGVSPAKAFGRLQNDNMLVGNVPGT